MGVSSYLIVSINPILLKRLRKKERRSAPSQPGSLYLHRPRIAGRFQAVPERFMRGIDKQVLVGDAVLHDEQQILLLENQADILGWITFPDKDIGPGTFLNYAELSLLERIPRRCSQLVQCLASQGG